MRRKYVWNLLFVIALTIYLSTRLLVGNYRQDGGDGGEVKPLPEGIKPENGNKSIEENTEKKLLKTTKLPQPQCSSDLLGATCASLLNSNITSQVYTQAKAFQNKYIVRKITDKEFTDSTRDCKKFIKSHDYHMTAGSKEEEEFPIAYNILTHKDVQQLEILLRAIYRPQNVYCVHIDDKQPAPFKQAVRSLVKCFNNVYVPSKVEKVVYEGFSRLQADINCMKDNLKHKVQWKYLFNIAAQSFPLKTNLEMVQILKIYNGSNDFEGLSNRVAKSRFVYEWKEPDVGSNITKMKKTGKRNPPPPYDIQIVRGSAYGVFSRKFVHYIINDKKAQALLEWSRKTLTPDEHYWSTLHHTYENPHLDSPGAYKGIPFKKPWLAVWVAWGHENKCHGMWKRGVCIFGVQDLPMLITRKEFFANKFYYDFHPLTLECLNNWIEYNVKCPPKLDLDYYRKLPFINNGKELNLLESINH